MLILCCPINQSGKGIVVWISVYSQGAEKGKLGQWAHGFSHPLRAAAGEIVLSDYFVSSHFLTGNIWVKAVSTVAMLFRNHRTAQILIMAAVLHVLTDAI